MSKVNIWIGDIEQRIPWTDFWPTLKANESTALSDESACAAAGRASTNGCLVRVSVCGDDPNWCVQIMSGRRWCGGWKRYGLGYGVRFGQAFEQAMKGY